MSELESGFRLGDVVDMIKRRFAVILGAAVLGLVAGYLVFASAPETFSATSRVRVDPIKLNPLSTDSRAENEVDMATEKDEVRTDAVADVLREELGLTGENRAILNRIAVVTEEDSRVLKITFVAPTADEARDGANAAAAGYLAERTASAAAVRDNALETLEAQITTATGARNEAQDRMDAEQEGTDAYDSAREVMRTAQADLDSLTAEKRQLERFDPATVGEVIREASTPPATVSKMAIGKGVGVFGLFVLVGLAVAWYLDRRDGLGGGRRRIEQLVPGANIRVMPGAQGTSASAAEIDTAIDRLAVEMVAGSMPGRAASVLVVGAGNEAPVALAEELASSLAFAGIPALFILAGSTERDLRQCHVVGSFADLLTQASVAGPAGLPSQAGQPNATTTTSTAAPSVTWLRPQGSAEASGLLRRAVVEGLVTKAARERFEAVVFVAPSPSRTAAATALGQWVGRTTLVIGKDERSQAETVAAALSEAGVGVAEVVWT